MYNQTSEIENAANPTSSLPTPTPVSAITLKLPPYWPTDPTVWFAQVEAQFATRNITNRKTKFQYVVSTLQPEIAQEIRDIIISPPTEKPYDVLKSELVKRTSASEQRRLQQLLTEEELGDKKPSQLLRKMYQLLGDNRVEEQILRQLFLQRLPKNAQLIIASSTDTVTLEQLATIADKILEVSLPSSSISAISFKPYQSTLPDPIATLQSQIDQLTSQLHFLTSQLQSSQHQYQPRSHGRSQSRSHSPGRRQSFSSRSPNRREFNSPYCFYHTKYGHKAHRCIQPCQFASATSIPSQPPLPNSQQQQQSQNQENFNASD